LNRCHNHRPTQLNCTATLSQTIGIHTGERQNFGGLILGEHYSGCVVSVSPMLPPIPQGWRSLIKEEMRKPYYLCALEVFLEK